MKGAPKGARPSHPVRAEGPAFAGVDAFLRRGGPPRIIAHRGFSAAAPENTLAAFRRAIEAGADMIELDVQASRDGRVVVIHDATVDRTTDGRGAVASMTYAELRRLDAGSWFSEEFAGERIPTLEEVLDLARDRILVNVEIKEESVGDAERGGIEERVADVVERGGMRRAVLVSSFEPRALARLRTRAPGIARAWLCRRRGRSPRGILARLDELGAAALHLSRRAVDRALLEAVHASGRFVAVYTVNDTAGMRRLVALGVDGLFTDDPDVLLAERASIAPAP